MTEYKLTYESKITGKITSEYFMDESLAKRLKKDLESEGIHVTLTKED